MRTLLSRTLRADISYSIVLMANETVECCNRVLNSAIECWGLHWSPGLCNRVLKSAVEYWALQLSAGVCNRVPGSAIEPWHTSAAPSCGFGRPWRLGILAILEILGIPGILGILRRAPGKYPPT